MLYLCVDILIAINPYARLHAAIFVALSPLWLQPAGRLSPVTEVEDLSTLGNYLNDDQLFCQG